MSRMKQTALGNMQVGDNWIMHDGSISGTLVGLNPCDAIVRVQHRDSTTQTTTYWSLATEVVPVK